MVARANPDLIQVKTVFEIKFLRIDQELLSGQVLKGHESWPSLACRSSILPVCRQAVSKCGCTGCHKFGTTCIVTRSIGISDFLQGCINDSDRDLSFADAGEKLRQQNYLFRSICRSRNLRSPSIKSLKISNFCLIFG